MPCRHKDISGPCLNFPVFMRYYSEQVLHAILLDTMSDVSMIIGNMIGWKGIRP